MNRRRFLRGLAAAATAAPLARVAGAASTPGDAALIDTNVWLGHWPTRRAWAETPAQLATKLRAHGVTAAWLGSFDAALHSDLAAANARLAEACAREGAGLFAGFGAINPTLPDWEDDLRRCAEVHRMPGLRLLPNYHGYGLDDPRFSRLLGLAAARRLLVQIAVTMEDDRSQNPALTAAPVNLAPLPGVLERIPGARVMLLNAASRLFGTGLPLLQKLSHAGALVEIATLEGVAGIEQLLGRAPGARVCFGSHAPYFYLEAALLKLQESALTPAQLAAVRHGNARAALAPA
jgi:predicted TIM-barrel fold metal-dependent hydrolase